MATPTVTSADDAGWRFAQCFGDKASGALGLASPVVVVALAMRVSPPSSSLSALARHPIDLSHLRHLLQFSSLPYRAHPADTRSERRQGEVEDITEADIICECLPSSPLCPRPLPRR